MKLGKELFDELNYINTYLCFKMPEKEPDICTETKLCGDENWQISGIASTRNTYKVTAKAMRHLEARS